MKKNDFWNIYINSYEYFFILLLLRNYIFFIDNLN